MKINRNTKRLKDISNLLFQVLMEKKCYCKKIEYSQCSVQYRANTTLLYNTMAMSLKYVQCLEPQK